MTKMKESKNTDIQKELNDTMLAYYKILLDEKRKQIEEENKLNDTVSFKKFHDMKDEDIVEEAVEAFHEKEKKVWMIPTHGNPFAQRLVVKKFLKLGIDLTKIFTHSYGLNDNRVDNKYYFQMYPTIEEQERIDNLIERIKDRLNEKKLECEEIEKNRIVKMIAIKAYEKGYAVINETHFKQLVTSVGLSYEEQRKLVNSGELRLYTTYVNQELKKINPIEKTQTTKRQPVSKTVKLEVFKRDGYTCRYCKRKLDVEYLEVDHIHPVSQGGTNEPENLATSCRTCNMSKGKSIIH